MVSISREPNTSNNDDSRSNLLPSCPSGQNLPPISNAGFDSLVKDLENYSNNTTSKKNVNDWILQEQSYFFKKNICALPNWENELSIFLEFKNKTLKSDSPINPYEIVENNYLKNSVTRRQWRGIPFKTTPAAQIKQLYEDASVRIFTADSTSIGIRITQQLIGSKTVESSIEVDQLFSLMELNNPYIFYRRGEEIYIHKAGQPFTSDIAIFQNYPELSKKNKYSNKSQYNFRAESFEADKWSVIKVRALQGDMSQNNSSYYFSDTCFIAKGEDTLKCLANVSFFSTGKSYSLFGTFAPEGLLGPYIQIHKAFTNQQSVKWEEIGGKNLSIENVTSMYLPIENDRMIRFSISPKKRQLLIYVYGSSGNMDSFLSLDQMYGNELISVNRLKGQNEFLVTTTGEDLSIQLNFIENTIIKTGTVNSLRKPYAIQSQSLPVAGVGNIKFLVKARQDLNLMSSENKVVIFGYGGFFNDSFMDWSSFENYLVERGYVVIKSLLRGDSGDSATFRNTGLKSGKWNTVQDIQTVANWAIEQKITRKGRISFLGGSNGGLVALLAASKLTSTLAGVVSLWPVTDLENLTSLDKKNAKFWEETDYGQWPHNKDISPLHVLSSDHVPILMIAGKDDEVVNWMHTLKMSNSLRKNENGSISFMYALVDGLGHKSRGGNNFELLEFFIFSYLESLFK